MSNIKFKGLNAKLIISLSVSCIYLSTHAQTGNVSTVAGAAGGFADNIVSKVEFNAPAGLTVDSSGNVYVADFQNHRIRKITPSGIVSTFAGNGTAGYIDGPGSGAEFNGPIGLTTDFENNIYVADQYNNCIRKITPSGIVSTYAGNGIPGNINGPSAAARFYSPCGVAIDASNSIYVADQFNNCIRKITSTGVVSTLAGGIQGYQDGTGINARFNGPIGIAVNSHGIVYVAEFGNSDIRKITPDGVVSTFAGNGFPGYADGTGTNALFSHPTGLTIDKQDHLFLADVYNNRIRKIDSFQVVTTVNNNDTLGFTDGTVLNAKFAYPWGVGIDKNGNLYTSDSYNHSVRKITLTGIVSTIAGNGNAGYADGLGANPEFYGPNSVSADVLGNLYVADLINQRIRKISPAGIVTTIAGNGLAGLVNGQGIAAEFHNPSGIALDAQRNIYVADALNHCIRKIDTAGLVTTFAGNGTAGFADGTGTGARFNHPNRVTLDAQGNVYVADVNNYSIRKITPLGVVTTIAGTGTAGFADGQATTAKFNYPNGVAVDNSGNVYVADYYNNRVRKISTNGMVSTLAGNGYAGYLNGQGTNAEFNNPGGIVINSQGDLYVADEGSHRIRKVTSTGIVSLWAGNGMAGYIDGSATNAEFNDPRGIGADSDGNVYVPDFNNNRIRKITNGPLPVTLLNFSSRLKGNNVLLDWQTATEENTNYFNIQRSAEGGDFSTIDKVSASGNSNSVKNYTYTDINIAALKAGKLYYRLQEVDRDGGITYSNIAAINIKGAEPIFSVTPNPVKDFINIFSYSDIMKAKISIMDMSGKTIYTATEKLIAGSRLQVPTGKLFKGSFIITVETGASKSKFKLIKE